MSVDSTLDQSNETDRDALALSVLGPEMTGFNTSFSELAPSQSIFAGVSPRSTASPRTDLISGGGGGVGGGGSGGGLMAGTSASPCASRSALEDWLVKSQLEAHAQVLKLNRVTIDGLLELTDADLEGRHSQRVGVPLNLL